MHKEAGNRRSLIMLVGIIPGGRRYLIRWFGITFMAVPILTYYLTAKTFAARTTVIRRQVDRAYRWLESSWRGKILFNRGYRNPIGHMKSYRVIPVSNVVVLMTLDQDFTPQSNRREALFGSALSRRVRSGELTRVTVLVGD